PLVAFAAGALLGDAVLHLLPEMAENGFDELASFSLLGGVLAFFLLEKALHWHHSHVPRQELLHPVAAANLVGDALHNLVDGAMVAGAYLASPGLGVATAVAVARLVPQGQKLLEVAAAPGGKSLVMGLEHPQALRVALDLRVSRVRLLAKATRVLSRPPYLLAADGTRPPLRRRSFDAVLLDAPCSGTGTLRRHPEIRWRLTPYQLLELASLQKELLAATVPLVKPGGFMLYATCSLEPEENEEVVASLGLPVSPVSDRLPPELPRVALASGGVLIPPGPWGDGFVVHLVGPVS
ncbi:MAG: hypothetical protein ACK42L_09380, partial [Thermoanaerobaculum sp.]